MGLFLSIIGIIFVSLGTFFLTKGILDRIHLGWIVFAIGIVIILLGSII